MTLVAVLVWCGVRVFRNGCIDRWSVFVKCLGGVHVKIACVGAGVRGLIGGISVFMDFLCSSIRCVRKVRVR